MDGFDQVRAAGESLAQRTVERVIDLAVHGLDVDELVQRVDLDTLLSHTDVNALLAKIDVNSLLGRVDLDALLDRVDVDALASRLDVNRLIAQVDIDAIVAQTDIPAVITMSAGSVANEAVDIVRGQAVGVDQRINRWVGRLLRRQGDQPLAPLRPAGPLGGAVSGRAPEAGWISELGHYASAASRFAAYAVDVIVSWSLFTLALAGVAFAIGIVTGRPVAWHLGGSVAVAVVFAAWELSYFAWCWAARGKTPGMALLGVRVVQADGLDAASWRGAVRALSFPLSIVLLGLGFTGILTQREHRALHDLIAGTAVVYAWDARAAQLRFLARARRRPAPGSR